jgi:hypothetical protein
MLVTDVAEAEVDVAGLAKMVRRMVAQREASAIRSAPVQGELRASGSSDVGYVRTIRSAAPAGRTKASGRSARPARLIASRDR